MRSPTPTPTRLNTHLPDRGDPGKAQARAALPLLRQLPLIVGVTLLGGVAGFVVHGLRPVSYEAVAQVYPVDPRDVGGSATTLAPSGPALVPSTVSAVRSERVLDRAAKELRTTGDELRGKVRAAGDTTSGAVEVTVSDDDAAGAAAALQAVLVSLERVVSADRSGYLQATQASLERYVRSLDQRLAGPGLTRAERDSLTSRLEAANARLEELAVAAAAPVPAFYRAAPVEVPRSPATPGTGLLVGAMALLGLVLSTAYAWRKAERTPQVRDRHDVAAVVGAPVLAELEPVAGDHRREVPDYGGPQAVMLDTLLRGGLLDEGEEWSALGVTGVGPGAAVGRVAMGLGVVAAVTRHRVQVVGVQPADVDAERALMNQKEIMGRTPVLAVAADGTVLVTGHGRGRAREAPDLVVVAEAPVSFDHYVERNTELHPAAVVLVVHRGTLQSDLRRAVDVLNLSGRVLIGCVFATSTVEARRRSQAAAGLPFQVPRQVSAAG
jgi:capsular polysaccharide biosynthesis protein